MSAMRRLSRWDLENTRVDLRRWSQQLLDISGQLTELVHDLGQARPGDTDGGAGDGGACEADEPGRGGAGGP